MMLETYWSDVAVGHSDLKPCRECSGISRARKFCLQLKTLD